MGDGVHVMWVCPGFTTSNIRQAALNKTGDAHGETPMDEGKMMSSEECAQHIIKAIRKKKKNTGAYLHRKTYRVYGKIFS
jgi:short-subunit dehydrogenase